MSALGRWWGSSRHGTQDGKGGEEPTAGPDTAGPPPGRRRRRFAWGPAHDVDLAPGGPAPGGVPHDGTHGAGATADDSRGAAGPGAARSQVPVADLLAAHPPTPPYGTPFDHDAVGGRAAAGPPGGVSSPPWRRPVTPPWGAPSETDDAPTTTVTIDGIGDASAPAGHSPASTAGAAGSGPDMSTSSPEAGTVGPVGPSTHEPRPDEPAHTDAVVTPTGGDGTVDPVSDTSAGDPAATPEAVTTTLAASTPGAGPTAAPAEPVTAGPAAPATPVPVAPEPVTPEPVTPEPATPGPAVATATPHRPRHAATTAPDGDVIDRHHLAQGRIGIDEVSPEVSGGRFPSKAVVGEVVPVGATVWREGHDAVAATVVWRRRPGATAADVASLPEDDADGADSRHARMTPVGRDTDRFAGTIVADSEGLWTFHVEGWSDPWSTWRHAVEVKAGAGQGVAELANDLETGARLLERGATGIEDRVGTPAPPEADGTADVTAPIPMPPTVAQATACREAAAALRDTDRSLSERLARALSEPIGRAMTEHPVRDLVVRSAPHHLVVERPIALAGSWYEFFPRSTGGRDTEGRPVHGTFATAARELDRVAAMGFDVAYLPPIHPVGTVNRKGRNNTLDPGPDDVGSPWAIGSAAGGHDAVDPNLGTIDDFDAFVARAHDLGLEVALDLALQCAPDHPWAAAHPEWFVVRPDGTIAYAENPPKRYQDIYPVNFDTDPDGIYAEVLRVVLYWMAHGVRVFRVDNPHTKPPDFWSWLIAEVHRRDPGVVFLAEAFTRPARLFGLAKAGFSQSYTYFTWRTGKQELEEFFELHRDRIDEARPNCFVNTPDILHESLQVGGPGMFALRAALAATLSPTWGVYSGFELFEYQPVRAGSEEYLDSEKYELRPRDFAGALAEGRSLEPWLTRLNTIRRAHPALRQIRTLRFHAIDNDALLAFSKVDPVSGDTVVCVITLNPFGAEDGTLRLDLGALGMAPYDRFEARDEVSGQVFDWGAENYVRLEPWRDVAHVVSVRRR